MKQKKILTYEISLLLALKCLLLFIVWYVCFSEPLDTHESSVMSQKTTQHFFKGELN